MKRPVESSLLALSYKSTMPASAEKPDSVREAPASLEEISSLPAESSPSSAAASLEDALFTDLPIPEPPPKKKRTRKAPTRTKGASRPKKPKSGMLETDIKSEALALFQKGMTAEAAARELMLPLSAVSGWHQEYEKGTLLKKNASASSSAPEEPVLF